MAPIATYVFLDLETTGLPKEEHNKTKITEISLVAAKRQHILDTRPGATPRVQHKITLCFNPGRLIAPSCSATTGLCNDLLEYETYFDLDVFNILNTFLNLLAKPVCLIAQNGHCFDYPILKSALIRLKVSFASDLLCADSLPAFYQILEHRKNHSTIVPEDISGHELSTQEKDTLIDEVDFACDLFNGSDSQKQNETTPTKPKVINSPRRPVKTNSQGEIMKNGGIKKRLPFSMKSKGYRDSYKLKDVYQRLLNRPALDAHRAEVDCVLLLECVVAICKEFVEWVDDNNMPFEEVVAMQVGVPLPNMNTITVKQT